MKTIPVAQMHPLIDLPLPPGLHSILSYTRSNELCIEFCMGEPEESARLALLLFDNDLDSTTIKINGIPAKSN